MNQTKKWKVSDICQCKKEEFKLFTITALTKTKAYLEPVDKGPDLGWRSIKNLIEANPFANKLIWFTKE